MNADFGNGIGLAPLDRPGPLRSQVKDALIELIISRQLAPGQHLVEADIAGQLQVSRQPVREALQSLHADDWVDLRPGRGAFVHDPTVAEVDEVFAVRTLLEERSAALAARNATPSDIDALRAICARGRATLADGDADGLVLLNATLHRRVTEMSGNRVLAEFIASLDRRVRWYFTEIAMTRGGGSWDEHEELCDAFAANDPKWAARVMHTHTEHSQRAYHERRQTGQEQPTR
jgi:DNA-binding GntR family transcriptional regulator